jgi:hypothetical protein
MYERYLEPSRRCWTKKDVCRSAVPDGVPCRDYVDVVSIITISYICNQTILLHQEGLVTPFFLRARPCFLGTGILWQAAREVEVRDE